MDEMLQGVLYTFYPDRIHHEERIVEFSKRSLPFVRNVVNKTFIAEGYLEEITVPKKGKKYNYFRLTEKGKEQVNYIHAKREGMRKRIAELIAAGMDRIDAAMQVAQENVETDKPTT